MKKLRFVAYEFNTKMNCKKIVDIMEINLPKSEKQMDGYRKDFHQFNKDAEIYENEIDTTIVV